MDHPIPPSLVQHLCNCSSLTPNEVERLIAEVLHFYGDTTEEFIIRRHRELQRSGQANAVIYQQIASELPMHRYRVSPLSTRQIRRAIYG